MAERLLQINPTLAGEARKVLDEQIRTSYTGRTDHQRKIPAPVPQVEESGSSVGKIFRCESGKDRERDL